MHPLQIFHVMTQRDADASAVVCTCSSIGPYFRTMRSVGNAFSIVNIVSRRFRLGVMQRLLAPAHE
jgi:hypothetical protein